MCATVWEDKELSRFYKPLSGSPQSVITHDWSAVLVMFECLFCGQRELPREPPVVGGEHGLSAQM